MTKLCAIHANKLATLTYTAMVLGLVACGGQPIQSEDDAVADKKQAAVEKAEPVVAKAPEPVVEPEPEPVVETMPHTQAAKPKIEMEPIPEEAAPGPEEKAEAAESSEMAAAPAPAEKVSSDAKAITPVAAGPNHFVVTVGPKDPNHPAYGKGHAMGFLVDGVSGKELVVERGQTYTFDISTDAKHDVYLSKKAVGWGGAPFAEGVEGDYTYKGTMTLKVDENTPDELFYACRNHPYMGAKIHVVNKGQTVDLGQQQATTSKSSVAAKAAAVSESKVKQKLMFAEMMINGQGAKRIEASQNDEAKQLLASAKEKLELGREKSQTGALPEALALANQSLKTLNEATKLVPGEEEQAQLAANYKTLQAEISDYRKSYKDNLKRMEKTGGVSADARIDEKKLEASLAKAKAFADKKDYVHANRVMQQVQKELTVALHKMLDSKTIVYDLKFETAKDEYEYELKRFTGYEELIPVAIEAKKPAPGAIKLMESFLSKARSRRDEAIAKAEAGDYPMAISMLLQATKTVRRALRMVGVTQ